MTELKVVILAAGKSTRMKSRLPKTLHEVAGKPILSYVLDQALSLDPAEIFCVVGHQSDKIREKYKDFPRLSFVEQTEQLGTAHALQQTQPFLKDFQGALCVLCGDVPLLRVQTLETFYADFISSGSIASVLTAHYQDPTGYGRIIRDAEGNLRQIVEEKDCLPELREIRECNTGTYLFRAQALFETLEAIKADNVQKEYYLTDIIQAFFLKEQSVGSTLVAEAQEVVGVNTRRDLALADAIARGWIMLDLLENQGVTLVDPATTYIDADVRIGQDTIIRPFSCIRSGVVIGEGCEIGPFAHLRRGTKLEDGAKAGAFVELKNAHFLAGAKAGHMAYLGDVEVGAHANIGAGAITANYNGEEKHRTVIGENAFIGCGTVLVAPVKVGKGGVTGANTVVPKGRDVSEGETVVGIPARPLLRKNKDA